MDARIKSGHDESGVGRRTRVLVCKNIFLILRTAQRRLEA